jgi:hypothetical protein
MLFWMRVKITVKVFGISGPFEEIKVQLVNAHSEHEAKKKFEDAIHRNKSNMQAESIQFQYLEFTGTLS